MYARIASWQLPPASFDQAIQQFTDHIVPAILASPGAVDAYLLTRPEIGHAVAVTLWFSEAGLKAFDQSVSELEAALPGAAPPSIEIYQVAWPVAREPQAELPLSETALGVRIVRSTDRFIDSKAG